MNHFQRKYNFKEEKTTKEYHRRRRMFCIYKDELRITSPNLSYSHAEWFEREGWITEEDDILMDRIVRGYMDEEKNIYFYTGYDFRINDQVEKIFFNYLDELLKRLEIDKENVKIYGGKEKVKGSVEWKPLKEWRGCTLLREKR